MIVGKGFHIPKYKIWGMPKSWHPNCIGFSPFCFFGMSQVPQRKNDHFSGQPAKWRSLGKASAKMSKPTGKPHKEKNERASSGPLFSPKYVQTTVHKYFCTVSCNFLNHGARISANLSNSNIFGVAFLVNGNRKSLCWISRRSENKSEVGSSMIKFNCPITFKLLEFVKSYNSVIFDILEKILWSIIYSSITRNFKVVRTEWNIINIRI